MEKATFLTPLGLTFLAIMAISILFLPRRYAVLPVIITALYMTLGQTLVVGGLNFNSYRIIVFFGWVRLILRKEITVSEMNLFDKVLVLFVLVGFVTGTLLLPTMDNFINRGGYAYNVILGFFLFRFLIRDIDDVILIFKAMAVMILPFAILMLVENSTGRNIFSVFGGVPEITVIRDGLLRCQGPFRHPILTGTFAATSFPYFFSLWFQQGKSKILAIISVTSAIVIIILSRSSGPILSFLVVIIALSLWPIRSHMKVVRWSLGLSIIVLHLFMKAPVWYIIGKLSEVVGGTGWHRSDLIDQAIKNFDQWWLLGTKYTLNWAYPKSSLLPMPDDPNMVDITNQFIFIGVEGGVFPLILFITIITMGFKGIGRALKAWENQPLSRRIIPWVLGVALTVHCASFFSVSYFDQMNVFWFLLLAMLSLVYGLSITKNNNAAIPADEKIQPKP